jgi:hypothetical protein
MIFHDMLPVMPDPAFGCPQLSHVRPFMLFYAQANSMVKKGKCIGSALIVSTAYRFRRRNLCLTKSST